MSSTPSDLFFLYVCVCVCVRVRVFTRVSLPDHPIDTVVVGESEAAKLHPKMHRAGGWISTCHRTEKRLDGQKIVTV